MNSFLGSVSSFFSVNDYLAIFFSLFAAVAFGLVNFYAFRIRLYTGKQKDRVFSFCGGVIAAYVFVDLIPNLQVSSEYLKSIGSSNQIVTLYEDTVFLVALIGFLLFFSLEYLALNPIKQPSKTGPKKTQAQSNRKIYLIHYFLFLFLDFVLSFTLFFEFQSSVATGLFFTFAVALHLFISGNSMVENYGFSLQKNGRYFSVVVPIIGWAASVIFPEKVPEAYVLLAFISGSILYIAIKDEIPGFDRKRSLIFFLVGAILYALLLIAYSIV